MIFFGLDIETTSADTKGELIQIGVFAGPQHQYVSDVGHRGNYFWEQEAFDVNGFNHERIINGRAAREVDQELCHWLEFTAEQFGVLPKEFIPVGFNVGSFDMQFVKKTFPEFSKLLSYHTMDLNAVLMYMYPDTFRDSKATAKTQAIEKLTSLYIDGNEHEALYDATMAFYIYEQLDNL